MKTINSLSGGKTSSYIAANYPADYNIFALVRTQDTNCLFPDNSYAEDYTDMVEAIVVIANDGLLLKAEENPYMMKDRPVLSYQDDTVPNRLLGMPLKLL